MNVYPKEIENSRQMGRRKRFMFIEVAIRVNDSKSRP